MSKKCNGLNGLPKALKQEELVEIIDKTSNNCKLGEFVRWGGGGGANRDKLVRFKNQNQTLLPI